MKKILLFVGVSTLLFACKTQRSVTSKTPDNIKTIKYLALGDSYTVGESVCEGCSFPLLLMKKLASDENIKVGAQVIAETGWTTSDLIQGIQKKAPGEDQDMVTLMIGVNNQYQGKDFSLFEEDFTTLLAKAIQLAGGDRSKVFVISIPDYAYTPFGQERPSPLKISVEIDQYNAFVKKTALHNGVSYINITDITREGLNNPSLVASDRLHPSKTAYSSFVSQILFEIRKKRLF
ncbi:SGNH/GDSL hydrolase family protein [Galbibacter sp. EGI 63066]|uniref:SGNH/GDSL hydrolase family protein n=1 Tax=Galbibacter sp. EGI 63066 TaxID=2993559 RepID=UPI002249253D|nr:SGNH/GDSL hydrolase family protein [Galbibacter sp. EGI 63066]MCX2679867.1 SGNH/GDSL hydrolase family protein [Galbibacter sp. EGI 63066]